jgi:multisite-specific tRNA:(cytosine-C5)-methyltransferase
MAVDAVAPPLNDSAPVDDASTEPAVPVASTPASDAEPPAKRPRLDPGDDAKAGVPVKPGSAKNPGREFREEPYSYVAVDHPEMQSALAFFGIRPATFDPANLLVRNDRGEPLRTVYHTSASVRAVVDANDYQRIRLVGCGAKLFARQDANKLGLFPCRWRILSDSVHFIRPHVAEARVVRAGLPTLRTLMDHYVDVEAFDEEGVRARLAEMGLGSALLEVQPGTDAAGAMCVAVD